MTATTFTQADIVRRANRLERVTQRRNFLEYLFGGAATAFLANAAISQLLGGGGMAEMLMGAGFALLAAGIAFAVVTLYLRSRHAAAPDPAETGVRFHRARLVQERDLLGSVWLWYIGPVVPGFVLIYGAGLALPGANTAFLVAAGGITIAFLAFVIVLNLRAARCINEEIAELDKLPDQA